MVSRIFRTLRSDLVADLVRRSSPSAAEAWEPSSSPRRRSSAACDRSYQPACYVAHRCTRSGRHRQADPPPHPTARSKSPRRCHAQCASGRRAPCCTLLNSFVVNPDDVAQRRRAIVCYGGSSDLARLILQNQPHQIRGHQPSTSNSQANFCVIQLLFRSCETGVKPNCSGCPSAPWLLAVLGPYPSN